MCRCSICFTCACYSRRFNRPQSSRLPYKILPYHQRIGRRSFKCTSRSTNLPCHAPCLNDHPSAFPHAQSGPGRTRTISIWKSCGQRTRRRHMLRPWLTACRGVTSETDSASLEASRRKPRPITASDANCARGSWIVSTWPTDERSVCASRMPTVNVGSIGKRSLLKRQHLG